MSRKLCQTERNSQSNKDRSDALEKLGEKLKSAQSTQDPNFDEKQTGWGGWC